MRRSRPIRRAHASQRPGGFSLLEVLIALVVLSVGLLGLAALQAEGLRGSSAAFQRSQAVLMASDLVDRMRANRAGLAFFKGSPEGTPVTEDDGVDGACSDAGHAGTAVAATNCDAVQMAKHALFEWAQSLPSGYSAVVQQVAGETNQFSITVQWTDRTTPGTQQFNTDVQF